MLARAAAIALLAVVIWHAAIIIAWEVFRRRVFGPLRKLRGADQSRWS